ncbi:uncharacterized protein LOC128881884 [Hylaeus volcanicus]|uniref:uncharacterized protein LOC128881884 n=1 Tax=Hylaeus volcanicus TaxID=313075 RepID=UPI0023B79640|nr:uncharacterized protein LOC128881884 [Hylaeus volcanicus]
MMSDSVCTVEQLNPDQRNAYFRVLDSLQENKVILIDTPSGTGKTFMLSLLAKTNFNTDKPVHFVTFRRDQASEMVSKQIEGYTYISYNMRNFSLSYNSAIRMFNMDSKNNIDLLYKVLQYSKSYAYVSHMINVIVLDTYTVASPIMLLLLYIVALQKNTQLIIAGDKLQPGPMPRSRFHGRNNFFFANTLSDLMIDDLTKNMRSPDRDFVNKLSRLREMLESYSHTEDIPLHFNFRYLLYCLFRPKYFAEERFDTVYMAQCHCDLTARLYRYIDHLESLNMQYVIEPFYTPKNEGGSTILMPLTTPRKQPQKFFPGLLLVIGCKYIHIAENGKHTFVCLEGMVYENNRLESLLIRPISNKLCNQQKIERCYLNYYQVLPAFRKWLLYGHNEDAKLMQFPLRIYTSTYHAALGGTVGKDVELCINSSVKANITINSVYAGLCCITRESAIHKMHADTDLLSLIVTEYMENERDDKEFYYRCPSDVKDKATLRAASNYQSGRNDFIDGMKWITASSISIFENENNKSYLRIERSKYKASKRDNKNTPLMNIAEFIKDNKNLVCNTIKTIPNEKSSVAIQKKKAKENYRESKAYLVLKEAYNSWKSKNVENEE